MEARDVEEGESERQPLLTKPKNGIVHAPCKVKQPRVGFFERRRRRQGIEQVRIIHASALAVNANACLVLLGADKTSRALPSRRCHPARFRRGKAHDGMRQERCPPAEDRPVACVYDLRVQHRHAYGQFNRRHSFRISFCYKVYWSPMHRL